VQGAAEFNGEITTQASIIAYIDDFKVMLVLEIIALPLVLLIRPTTIKVAGSRHPAIME
jgi:DHA2 family multidrug resistance protein